MTINRSGWMLCSLVLLGCGAIGDVSEKVGGMINPHLEVLGGGAPVVSEDGGDPVFTYLQHVGDEPYQECREWREDWTRARLEGDSEALAELKDEVEDLTEALNEVMESHLEQLELKIPLVLPDEVGPRVGGPELELDACSFHRCALRCETVVDVQEPEEEDKAGNPIKPGWSQPSGLLSREGTDYTQVSCEAPAENTGKPVQLNPNRWKWLWEVSLLDGADAEGLEVWMGPSLDILKDADEDEERDSVDPGDRVKIRVDGLDQCLEKNLRQLVVHQDRAPLVSNLSARCTVAEEWNPVADHNKKKGTGDFNEVPEFQVANDYTEAELLDKSLVISFRMQSPLGLQAFGFDQLGMTNLSPLSAQIISTQKTEDDEIELASKDSPSLTCRPEFKVSAKHGGSVANDKEWKWPSDDRMMKTLRGYGLSKERLKKISDGEGELKRVYTRELTHDPNQEAICVARVSRTRLQMNCADLETRLKTHQRVVIQDSLGNWSESVRSSTAGTQTLYVESPVTPVCIESSKRAKELRWRGKQWDFSRCHQDVGLRRAGLDAYGGKCGQLYLDTYQGCMTDHDKEADAKTCISDFEEELEDCRMAALEKAAAQKSKEE